MAATAPTRRRRIRAIDLHDRLSVTDHLEELRWRIITTAAFLVAVFGVCWWRADELFALATRPLGDRYELTTLGVTEPFFATLTMCAVVAGLATFPVGLFQAWRYVRPALDPAQRRAILPVVLAAPGLLAAGAAFAYLVVLGPATRFLLGMGENRFDVAVRAQDYYSFLSTTILGCALAFQLPLVLVGLARVGILSAERLRSNRRLAYVGIAVLAALLPTADPVSLILEMLPLLALFELSILLVARTEKRLPSEEAAAFDGPGPPR